MSSETEYAYGAWTNPAPHNNHRYLRPVLERMLLRCSPIERLLDVGCGNGTLTDWSRRHAREVYACDMSESGTTLARALLGDSHVALASAYDDFKSLFFGVESFDVILSAEVIEHLYVPRRFLQRARSALRPGGKLILTTPYHGYIKNLMLAVSGKLEPHFQATTDGGHIKFWSRATLSALLEEAGFRDIQFAGAGRAPWLWCSMVLMATAAD